MSYMLCKAPNSREFYMAGERMFSCFGYAPQVWCRSGRATMKVKDLMEALAAADPEAEVILQKDAEGNGYSPLESADLEAVYVPTTTWYGDVFSLGWTADDACKTADEWAEIIAKPRCVVLAPVN